MKGIEEIIAERSKAEEQVEIAKKMLKCDESLEKIALLTGLTLEHVKNIQ